MQTVNKVGAFVLRLIPSQPAQLLLFTHVDFPDAPIQIPGGGMESDEQPEEAVKRELMEEAGLCDLPLLRKLGVSEYPVEDGRACLQRHCYLFDGSHLPDTWIHSVTGTGEDLDLRFEYRWHAIDSAFRLSGDLGYFLNALDLPELYPAGTVS